MKKIIIFSVVIISLVFLLGCTQPAPTQKEYICWDGTTVSDSSLCPKKGYTCYDGTEVNDKSECCETGPLGTQGTPQVAPLSYCKDKFGTYSERIYCEGDYSVFEAYSCSSNRCVKNMDKTKCVEGATCEPYGNSATCVSK